MKNEMTNVYDILKREFKEEVEYFHLENSKELDSFLHYNAHNEMFIGTDEYYYHNVNFKNLDTEKESRMFREGNLYFFPKEEDLLMPEANVKGFRIGTGTKSIQVNNKGLFVERNDLSENIVTNYYDNAALEKIADKGLAVANIDYIEERIQDMGILPDRIIKAVKKDGTVSICVVENDEIVNQIQFPIDDSRTMYSVYYEWMKANHYYNDILYAEKNLNRS